MPTRCPKAVILIALACVPAFSAAATEVGHESAAQITGIAIAHDGDDVRFGRVQIRIRGIAAPEDHSRSREAGGAEARRNLAELVDGQEVTCILDGSTAGWYRPVGTCFAGKLDIGRYQVITG